MFFIKNMIKPSNYHLKINSATSFVRIIQSRFASAYEGTGKSTISIMNKEKELGLLINSYSNVGFRLNNDISVVGPIILFPRMVLSWNIKDLEDINEKSLGLFKYLEPKIDVLIVGVGNLNRIKDHYQICSFLRKSRTNVEILDTQRAVSTYNFLVADHRNVAAALIPPTTLSVTDNDVANARKRQGKFMNYNSDADPLI